MKPNSALKELHLMTSVEISPGIMQHRFNIQISINMINDINRLKKKMYRPLSIDRKCSWQNPIPIHDTNSQQVRNRIEQV